MTFIVWLSLGVVIGYLGSLTMGRTQTGAVVSRAAGILGALLAGPLLAPLLRGGAGRGFFSLRGVLVPLPGAVILVGLVSLLRARAASLAASRHRWRRQSRQYCAKRASKSAGVSS